MMGQINVKIPDEMEKRLDVVAAAMGMQRPDLLRKVYHEVILAHENGGVAFAQGEGLRIDIKASELLLQVKDLLIENERSRRDNLKLGERLLRASNGGEEAYRHALEELTGRLVAQREEANLPFQKEVDALRADIAALPVFIGNQLVAELAPLAKDFANVAREARAPKNVRNLIVGGEFIQEWPVISTIASVWYIIGILTLLIAGNFMPGLGRSLANQFVDDDVALCIQINDRFQTKNCALPDLKRRNALNTINLDKLP